MNNNYNIIRILRERVLRNSYLSYHAPLIFDIHSQKFYRKPGYVAWPETEIAVSENKEAKEKQRNRLTNSPYFAYPQK